jgi:hypothetical protein
LERSACSRSGSAFAAAQNAHRSRRVGARVQTGPSARDPAQRGDHFRAHLNVGIDHQIVGVGKLALMDDPARRSGAVSPVFT